MRRAVAFLTPFGRAGVPDPGSLRWFPVVGAAMGGVLGLVWWAVAKAWPPGVAAAVVVAADLGLTGLLHVDGLVDAADGLLPPHADRARRLEVMRDPAAGAFGVCAVGAVLLLRWAALGATAPSVLLLVGIWAMSRSAMAVVAVSVPYARADGGLASAFLGVGPPDGEGHPAPTAGGAAVAERLDANRIRTRAVVVASGVALAAGGCLGWKVTGGAVALAAGIVAAAGVVWLATRRLGGFTGDVLGAAGVVGETVALVVAAARW